MGQKVLRVRRSKQRRAVRVYAFCSAQNRGHVTFVFLNTLKQPVSISLIDRFASGKIWQLISQPGNPLSRTIYLNGHALAMEGGGQKLPLMQGLEILQMIQFILMDLLTALFKSRELFVRASDKKWKDILYFLPCA